MTAVGTDWPIAPFTTHLHAEAPSQLFLEHADGVLTDLQSDRWHAAPTIADLSVVCRSVGPVLDIGCGPGRLTKAVAHNNTAVLGIDVTAGAVRLARSAGAFAIHRSVFDPLPGAGRWQTALLIDGNVGIGGDPDALLIRVRQLLRPGGRLIVELEDPQIPFFAGRARLRSYAAPSSGWFAWARVPVACVDNLADRTGFIVVEAWSIQRRWFATLESAPSR